MDEFKYWERIGYGLFTALGAVIVVAGGRILCLTASDWAAWVQAVGSVTTIGLGVWVFYAQQKGDEDRTEKREAAEVKALLRSLRAEIDVVVSLFEKRNGKLLRDSKPGEIFSYIIPVQDRPFIVYENCVAHIGKIPNDGLRQQIIVAYGKAQGFVASIRFNNGLLESLAQARHLESPLV
jgi:hypothetical protein